MVAGKGLARRKGRRVVARLPRCRRRLRYAGKVGTGFSEAELERLDALLTPIEQSASPFTGAGIPRDAHFVVPRHVAEVRFAEWTEGGRIRQPAYLGRRDDKCAQEVVREG